MTVPVTVLISDVPLEPLKAVKVIKSAQVLLSALCCTFIVPVTDEAAVTCKFATAPLAVLDELSTAVPLVLALSAARGFKLTPEVARSPTKLEATVTASAT